MNCPVCDSSGVVEVVAANDDTLSECVTCGHLFQSDLKVTQVYDKHYIEVRYDAYETTPLMSHLRLGIVTAVAHGPKLLDVGYGNGDFIKAACKAGFDGFGNDVHGADYGVKEIDLHADMLAQTKWDVVTFFDSIEHITTFEVIRDLGRRTHTIIVSIPRKPSYFPCELDWRHYRPGEHLHYFSTFSLQKLFAPKWIRGISHAEDVIRGKLRDGRPNIDTVILW